MTRAHNGHADIQELQTVRNSPVFYPPCIMFLFKNNYEYNWRSISGADTGSSNLFITDRHQYRLS